MPKCLMGMRMSAEADETVASHCLEQRPVWQPQQLVLISPPEPWCPHLLDSDDICPFGLLSSSGVPSTWEVGTVWLQRPPQRLTWLFLNLASFTLWCLWRWLTQWLLTRSPGCGGNDNLAPRTESQGDREEVVPSGTTH